MDAEGASDGPERSRSADVELEVDHIDAAAEAEAQAVPATGSLISVMIVDDDPDMRRYVRRALRHMGHRIGEVVEAKDGVEALVHFRDAEPGLVISDVVMPVMDGYALSRAIRERKTPGEIPILLITGEASVREATTRAREAGAQGVVIKPFNAHTLCQAVEGVLDSCADGPEPATRT